MATVRQAHRHRYRRSGGSTSGSHERNGEQRHHISCSHRNSLSRGHTRRRPTTQLRPSGPESPWTPCQPSTRRGHSIAQCFACLLDFSRSLTRRRRTALQKRPLPGQPRRRSHPLVGLSLLSVARDHFCTPPFAAAGAASSSLPSSSMWPWNDFSLAVMSLRAISSRSRLSVPPGRGCALSQAVRISLSSSAAPISPAATGGHDDPPDHQQHRGRRDDEPDVGLPVRAAINDHRAGTDRHEGEHQQREANYRQETDGALVFLDRGEIAAVHLLGLGKQRRLHQRRCFSQVGGTDGEALTVVRPCRFDQCGVRSQLLGYLRHRGAGFRVRGSGGRVGESRCRASQGLLILLAHRGRLIPPERNADAAAASAAERAA